MQAVARLAGLSSTRAAVALEALVAQESPPDGAVALAEELVGRLRRDGELVRARTLAVAGARRSRELRLGAALLAFAAGDDEEAKRLSAEDAEIEGIVAPLLRAARREEIPPRGRGRRGIPALASLHDAARAVACAGQGKLKDAQRLAGQAPPGWWSPLRDAIALAARVPSAAKRALPATRSLAGSYPREAPIVAASLLELAELDPEAAAVGAGGAEVPDEVASRVLSRAATARLGGRPATAEVALELARVIGPRGFDPRDAGAAWLFQGFALFGTDPAGAARAFDRAIELGGDVTEALRGKLLLAMKGGSTCNGCGVSHGDPVQVATAAERLAKALRHLPLGAPFAAEAWIIAAETWLGRERTESVIAALDSGRRAASASQRTRLDLVEAALHAERDPGRALRIIDDLLDTAPAHVEATLLKITLLRRLGRDEESDAFTLRAAATSPDRDLAAMARKVKARRGVVTPFEGFVPGIATAGALAADLDLATRALPEGSSEDRMTPLAWACRAALPDPARMAFDLATLVIRERTSRGPSIAARFAAVVVLWEPADVFRLTWLAWELMIDPIDARPAADALAALPGGGRPGLVALAQGASDARVAKMVLSRFGAGMSRVETTALQRVLVGPSEFDRPPRLVEVARELEPDFDLLADDEEDEQEEDLGDLPAGLLAALPASLRARVERLQAATRDRRIAIDPAEMDRTMRDVARALEKMFGPMPARLKRGLPWT